MTYGGWEELVGDVRDSLEGFVIKALAQRGIVT
jgi:hypothetical protein